MDEVKRKLKEKDDIDHRDTSEILAFFGTFGHQDFDAHNKIQFPVE